MLLRSDLEGMQPTLRQVPPRRPRFSIQVTYDAGKLSAREARARYRVALGSQSEAVCPAFVGWERRHGGGTETAGEELYV